MIDFYQAMADALKRGPVVLATVAMVKGSVPREAGAKMLIYADGQSLGTIGGGAGEAKVYQQALTLLQSTEKQVSKKQWVEIDLSGAPHRETQGVCGGTMQVWLECWAGVTAIALVDQILEILRSDQPGAIAHPFASDQAPSVVRSLETPLATLQVTPTGLLEPLLPLPLLVIVGAGHVAVPLAQMAQMIGFQIVVVDDRPEYARVERFPQGAMVFAQPVEQAFQAIPQTANLYAALVTRGYLHDLDPLKLLLQRPTRYIGMIGSEKRVRLVHQALVQAGYPAEVRQQLYAPIGLDIGALTPEEIAVSICAELIQVRRGGQGQSLSIRLRTAAINS